MTEENIVIKHLQAIRATLDDHGERLDRIEARLSNMEQTIGSMYAGSGDDRNTMRSLARRLDRVERRLELRDDS